MRKLLTVLLSIFFSSSLVFGQTRTVVTANIQSPNGGSSSGYVEFRLTPAGSGIAYRVVGQGVIAPLTARCNIQASGVLLATDNLSPCQVWGNTALSPANTCYNVVIAPGNVVTSTINNELISGTTYDLSSPTFCPSVTSVSPQQAAVTVQPIQSNLIPGANNAFTLGSSTKYYSSAYIDQLFVNSLNDPVATATIGSINNRKFCSSVGGFGTSFTSAAALLPSTGGTVDCSNLQGAQVLSSDVFTGQTKPLVVIMPTGTVSASTSITSPSTMTVEFPEGGVLSMASGTTATINGEVRGTMSQHFAGAGNVLFGLTGNQSVVYPQWWGAKGDNSTDNTTAFASAIASQANIAIPCGVYLVNSSVRFTSTNQQVIGAGRNCAQIKANSNISPTVILDSVQNVVLGHMYISNATTGGIVVQLATSSGDDISNVFTDLLVSGAGQGTTSATTATTCFDINPGVGHNAYFNHFERNVVANCNTLFKLTALNSNANYFEFNRLENYWKAWNIAGIENIIRGNFLNNSNGASSSDPTIAVNLLAGASYNDIELPPGEPGPNSQAIAIASTVTTNRLSNSCVTGNYALGFYQGGSASFGNSGKGGNVGIDQPECNRWSHDYYNLRENETYGLSTITFAATNSGADVVVQWDSTNNATNCLSGGQTHALIKNQAGAIGVVLNDVSQQSFGSGCAVFTGWNTSGFTATPMFYNTDNGGGTTATETNVTFYMSGQGITANRLTNDKGLGNVTTGLISASYAGSTAKSKGYYSRVVNFDFAAWAGGGDCQTQTTAYAEADLGDVVSLGLPQGLMSSGGMSQAAWVNATGSVAITLCKPSAGAFADPASLPITIDVRKY